MGWGGSIKEVVKKYGRVALGIHLTVSGLSFSACYLAILNSVDVEGILEKAGLGSWLPHEQPAAPIHSQSGAPTNSRASAPSHSHSGTPSSSHSGTPSNSHSNTPGSSLPAAPIDSQSGAPSGSQAASPSNWDHREAVPNTSHSGREAAPEGAAPGAIENESRGGGVFGSLTLAKGGGAFAMAWLCNKALFPVRVPITIGLTPPVWRYLVSKGFRV